MSNNRFYDEIMQLEESKDMQEILKRWKNFAHNRTKLPPNAPVVLPDMLWIAKSGYGKTNLLQLISEYLYEEKIMEFYGDVKYFEFSLAYCAPEQPFRSFEQFQDALLNAAGFRSEFRGVICVEIDEWMGHLRDKYFVDFLEYMSERSEKWHIIFVTECREQERLGKLEAMLDMYFRIDKVVFVLPETPVLCQHMEKYVNKYGFYFSEKAREILAETIDTLRNAEYFDGYKTLNMICTDLLYREFSSETFGGFEITADMVRYYAKDSDFIKRTKNNMKKKNRIGFVTEEEDDHAESF